MAVYTKISNKDIRLINSKFDIDEIGVINITVNKAADRTANGYLAILIII